MFLCLAELLLDLDFEVVEIKQDWDKYTTILRQNLFYSISNLNSALYIYTVYTWMCVRIIISDICIIILRFWMGWMQEWNDWVTLYQEDWILMEIYIQMWLLAPSVIKLCFTGNTHLIVMPLKTTDQWPFLSTTVYNPQNIDPVLLVNIGTCVCGGA